MAEIFIDDIIGEEWGVGPKRIRDKLNSIQPDEPIVVRVNSPGGYVADGFAIYNMLRERKQNVTTIIEGAAWSIASLIAIAGDKTIARPASSLMIHDAWGVTVGDAEDHLTNAAALDKLSETIASAYAAKTGKTPEEMREMMKKETWLTPEEAKDVGLIDAVEEPGSDASNRSDAVAMAGASKWSKYAEKNFKRYKEFVARWSGPARHGDELRPRFNQEGESMKEETIDKQTTAAEPVAAANDTETTIPVQAGDPPNDQAKATSRPLRPMAVLPPRSVHQDALQDHLIGKSPEEQRRFLQREWHNLKRAFPLFAPMGANTDQSSPAGALVPAILSATVITVLQNRLAALSAFARNLQAGRIGRNQVQVPIVTAYGSAQTNPTNFENTTAAAATFRNVAITPQHISVLIHLDNAEAQNGYQISWFSEIKAAELADAIQQRVNALLTTTNFTGPNNYAKLASDWTSNDLKAIWARLSKASVKNIILSSNYYSKHLPDNMESFNPLQGNTYPGWDGFFLNTNWTGAGTGVEGFACNPQAIAVAAGLPTQLPDFPNRPASTVITLENNGLQVENFSWFSPATRTMWMSLDVMFGAALGDASAGVIIRNAAT